VLKPEYCEKIKSGNKKFEFRKKIFKRQDDIESVYIYATSPVKKIVGLFTFETILKDSPENLWERCKTSAGIERETFLNYFEGKNEGFAIKN
jgi:predicted transcriptional regulator